MPRTLDVAPSARVRAPDRTPQLARQAPGADPLRSAFRGWSNQAIQRLVVLQRVPDPDGSIVDTLRVTYGAVRQKYGKTYTLPKPSDLTRTIRGIVATAATKDAAYTAFARQIVTEYFRHGSNSD